MITLAAPITLAPINDIECFRIQIDPIAKSAIVSFRIIGMPGQADIVIVKDEATSLRKGAASTSGVDALKAMPVESAGIYDRFVATGIADAEAFCIAEGLLHSTLHGEIKASAPTTKQ